MKKLIISTLLMIYLLSACSSYTIQPVSIETPNPTSAITPFPPTETATVTATVTPLPVPINADNFHQIEQISSSILDQSKFVGFFEINRKDFREKETNIPDGDFTEGYFESYRRLENGDVLGLLIQFPLNCGLKTFFTKSDRNCSYNRYYVSVINLSKSTTLFTQYLPVNMAGKELANLVEELDIKDFKPRPLFSNRGFMVNKWSNDNLQIVIPIQVVNSTLVKDTLSGKKILVHPWVGSASWIGAMSPDKTKFAFVSGGPKGGMDTLNIMDVADQSIDFRYEITTSASDLAWSNDNSKIAVGKNTGSVDIVNLATKQGRNLIERRLDITDKYWGASQRGITRIKFSDDGNKIAFTENNYVKTDEKISKLVIYNLETLKEENSFAADFDQSGEIIWSHDGSFVITVTDFTDGQIVLLNDNQAIEYQLAIPDKIEEYYPKIFTSLIYFNEDQTQLTLIRSLFNDAEVTVYEVKE
jgi:hypothetical protein